MPENTRRGSRPENGTRTGANATGRPEPAQGPLDLFALVEQLKNLLAKVRRILHESAPQHRVLSYREVVGHLAENRPASVPDARGVLQRKRRAGGWFFRVCYIDGNDDPVTDPRTGKIVGFTRIAADCDSELNELFAENDVIIFE
jgi:hypothetical protein